MTWRTLIDIGTLAVCPRAKIHYFNIPCDVAPDSPFNPLNILKAIYKPGDYVVIKLDIDNEPVEQASALSDARLSCTFWCRVGIQSSRVLLALPLLALRGCTRKASANLAVRVESPNTALRPNMCVVTLPSPLYIQCFLSSRWHPIGSRV